MKYVNVSVTIIVRAKNYSWNPVACICENMKNFEKYCWYFSNCNKNINATYSVSTNLKNSILTNITSNVSTNVMSTISITSDNKKLRFECILLLCTRFYKGSYYYL